MTEDTTQIPVGPMPTISAKRSHMKRQFIFVVIFGFLLALAALFAIVMGFEAKHENAIFPGVSVNGTDLSGPTVGQAVVKLNNGGLTYPKQGQIFFTDGDPLGFQPWSVGLHLRTDQRCGASFLGRGQGLLADLAGNSSPCGQA